MTKKIKKLEQETSLWKSKFEASDKCLQGVIKQVYLIFHFNFNSTPQFFFVSER